VFRNSGPSEERKGGGGFFLPSSIEVKKRKGGKEDLFYGKVEKKEKLGGGRESDPDTDFHDCQEKGEKKKGDPCLEFAQVRRKTSGSEIELKKGKKKEKGGGS